VVIQAVLVDHMLLVAVVLVVPVDQVGAVVDTAALVTLGHLQVSHMVAVVAAVEVFHIAMPAVVAQVVVVLEQLEAVAPVQVLLV
jgi:hypothetical protein